MAERLQKVMANAGVASRRASEKLILAGKVKVNGQVIKELGVKVDTDDVIEVNGHLVERENKVYYLFYKPRGVISAASDDKGRKVVTDFFADQAERVYPVGRLDYDTSGLLLMTNDGELANKLMHPRYKVNKTYVAKVKGIVKNEALKRLRTGVDLNDGRKRAKGKAKVLSFDKKNETSIISLTIHEGRNHQVKNMLQAVGHPVKKLKRETYGFLNLDGLVSGQYRELSRDEVKQLYDLATPAH